MKTAAEIGLLVRIENPPGASVGKMLSDMRTWLDHQGINPVDFKPVTLAYGGIAFEVFFRHLQQAALFRDAFDARDTTVESRAAPA